MSLAKLFKQFSKLNKKDSDFKLILSKICSMAGDDEFRGCVEIQISREFFEYHWSYYVDSKGKKISSEKYEDKRDELLESTNEILKNIKNFEKEWTQFYDPSLYEKDLNRLQTVCVKLNKMGFKTKISYSKDYKRKTTNDQPNSIWLIVKW